ncbi:hypothetical protein [Fidelibacter multiformis]|jgi:hypothetical protein|uniref:hypothetical protein n=1 Tax=Fidelibacter multiformis TaxID=3377529 RepID=UPI0037DDA9EA
MHKKITTFLLLLLITSAFAQVPDVVIRTLDHKNVHLRDYVGEPRLLRPDASRYGTVLVFFRTDDPTLESWFDDLNRLIKETKTAKRKFFYVAVNQDVEILKTFKQSHKLSAPLYMDVFNVCASLLESVPGTLTSGPGIVIYQPDGTFVEKFVPFQSHQADHLKSAINRLP